MTCFRTPQGATLHSALSPRQYSRFFYELNTNEQPFAQAYRIAVNSKPREPLKNKSVGSLFSPENIKKLQALKNKRGCSTLSAVRALSTTNKLRIIGGKE